MAEAAEGYNKIPDSNCRTVISWKSLGFLPLYIQIVQQFDSDQVEWEFASPFFEGQPGLLDPILSLRYSA
jgi:hypothetical protein